MDRAITRVKQVAALSDWSTRDVRHLLELTTEVRPTAGRMVEQEARYARQFVLVLEGHLTMETDGRYVRALGPGDIFGQAIDDRADVNRFSVRCDSDCVLLAGSRRDFVSLSTSLPKFADLVAAAAQRDGTEFPRSEHASVADPRSIGVRLLHPLAATSRR